MYKNFFKGLIDFVLSLVGSIILALPMLILIVAIKIDDPGPAFFKQQRVGKGKKLFWLYKFRSMKKGADEASYYAGKTLSKVRRKLGFVNL